MRNDVDEQRTNQRGVCKTAGMFLQNIDDENTLSH